VYFDHDWPIDGSGRHAALAFMPDGRISWSGRHQVGTLAVASEATAVAASALMRVAQEAADAASGRHGNGLVEITGSGLVAALVRRLLGVATSDVVLDPSVVVDTTGDPEVIGSALDRVRDLGTVILAGESCGRPLDHNLYRSVHRRGLTVIGIPSPGDVPNVTAGAAIADQLLAFCREELVEVERLGSDGGALWYLFVA
jgi:threonine dehydrogenase-like Zn-dependent dehydrogenase